MTTTVAVWVGCATVLVVAVALLQLQADEYRGRPEQKLA